MGTKENIVDVNGSVKLSENIYWVGHSLPDDNFQCHVYLIENGTDSILIDPGSKLTFKHVLKKVEEIIPFNHIRYFICQHQDPDITGALPLIDQLVTRSDAKIISHWRAIALLKHYGLELPFWCVEENNWTLELKGGRILEFIFTPYMHFPGAFCTFDTSSGILFSSDIFGAFTESFSLFAEDESFFEGMRLFHEHYMPSKEILFNGLTKLEKYPVKIIAPQHGSIIPETMVDFYFKQLKNVDCGIYLMTQTNTDILHLSKLNTILRDFMETMVLYKSFSDIGQALLELIRRVLPVESFECFTLNPSCKILHFAEENLFKGVHSELPEKCEKMIGMDKLSWNETYKTPIFFLNKSSNLNPRQIDENTSVVLPLYSSENLKVHGILILKFSTLIELDNETAQTLVQISAPLGVAVEREMIQRSMEMEKQRFYEQAIKDSLTGLYTRIYMKEAVSRLFSIHDRNPSTGVAVIMFDLDHFKKVNDTYGHNAGDYVLEKVAGIILAEVRESDIPVRMGGEEFAVFITGEDLKTVGQIAERVRSQIFKLKLDSPLENECLSISAGVAFRRPGQPLNDLIHDADTALYAAKKAGRNQVIFKDNLVA